MSKKLNFMCVGVQKAGTSTIHDILNQHPDLSLPIYKETHFFCEDEKFEKGLQYYFDFFFKSTDSKYLGEIDPEYSFFKDSAKKIHYAFGEIKVVFILRNPVDRAFSHYLMTKRRGLENLSFQRALEDENERLVSDFDNTHFSYASRGLYLDQIINYETVFGKDNVEVLLFDDLIQNRSVFFKKLTGFIGLDYFDYNFDVKSNPASVSKNKKLSEFIYRPNRFKKAVGKLVPSKSIKNKIMFFIERNNLKETTKEDLTLDEKKRVYETYFKKEVKALEGKLMVDLTKWKY